MPETEPVAVEYENPPVVNTRLGVQFSPFARFQSGHFGLFWSECLGLDEWQIREDMQALPIETEQFGDKRLRPPTDGSDFVSPQVRMRLANPIKNSKIEFQANRLLYGWGVANNHRPSYSVAKVEFVELFDRLERFAAKWKLGNPVANFWDVVYLNIIPQGSLWQKPSDWSQLLPGLYPHGGPAVTGHEWATFSGEWYFEIAPQVGRVIVRTQKVVVNPNGDLALLLEITARGIVGATGATDWSSGLDIGHQSAIRVFNELTSPEARKEWGLRP